MSRRTPSSTGSRAWWRTLTTRRLRPWASFFRPLIPDKANVLDLMSAYLTHLPPDVWTRCHSVVGLGMSDAEMAANAQLTGHVVHDLNANPTLPLADDSFDVALCTVSVQYLLHPEEVFAEVCRVLRPGAPFIVSFSNRCFPTKATRLWLSTDDAQHAALVRLYFERGGRWEGVEAQDISPCPGRTDPLYVVWARKADGVAGKGEKRVHGSSHENTTRRFAAPQAGTSGGDCSPTAGAWLAMRPPFPCPLPSHAPSLPMPPPFPCPLPSHAFSPRHVPSLATPLFPPFQVQ